MVAFGLSMLALVTTLIVTRYRMHLKGERRGDALGSLCVLRSAGLAAALLPKR